MELRKPSGFRELLTPEDFKVPRRIVPPPYPVLPPAPFETPGSNFKCALNMHLSSDSDGEDITGMRIIDSKYDHSQGHRKSMRKSFGECSSLNEVPVMPMVVSGGCVREGIIFDYVNYYEFLRSWVDESNNILFKISNSPVLKRVDETFTPTTHAERSRIILPAGVFDRNELLHCDIAITGLPPSVFFGSGFGHRSSLARNAAAKDLIDRCFRLGLITGTLHKSIGNHPFLEKKDLPRKDYSLAVNALVDLDRKLSSENWPWELYTVRELEPHTLDRLKAVFNSVIEDIYFHDRENQNEYLNSHTAANQSTISCTVDSRDKTDFCRNYNLYGHMESYCRQEILLPCDYSHMWHLSEKYGRLCESQQIRSREELKQNDKRSSKRRRSRSERRVVY